MAVDVLDGDDRGAELGALAAVPLAERQRDAVVAGVAGPVGEGARRPGPRRRCRTRRPPAGCRAGAGGRCRCCRSRSRSRPRSPAGRAPGRRPCRRANPWPSPGRPPPRRAPAARPTATTAPASRQPRRLHERGVGTARRRRGRAGGHRGRRRCSGRTGRLWPVVGFVDGVAHRFGRDEPFRFRRPGGRGRRCRRRGAAASTWPAPRSGGSAPG